MAAEFIIHCRTMKPNEERETYSIKSLKENSTIDLLKEEILKITGIEIQNQKITGGLKMEPLEVELKNSDSKKRINKFSRLDTVSISNGSTIFLETYNAPKVFERGFMDIHYVPLDNNSLFTSLYVIKSKGLINPDGEHWMEMYADEIRSEIAKAVQENTEKYNKDFLGMNPLDYCNYIKKQSHWGGAIELEILTDIYDWQIFTIHQPSLMYKRYGWFHRPKVFLIYEGLHYAPLLMTLEDGSQSGFFKWLDYFGIDMVLEFVRNNRELVPTLLPAKAGNFTLKCLQCFEIMKSDKEAREHALETEHTDFSE